MLFVREVYCMCEIRDGKLNKAENKPEPGEHERVKQQLTFTLTQGSWFRSF